MRIPPIADAAAREDLVAFLVAAEAARAAGAMGGVAGHRMPDLEAAPLEQRVVAIRHCADAYYVTLGTGDTLVFWEFSLRFKTDSSPEGRAAGRPAIVPTGGQGHRAQAVFKAPAEFSVFIREDCRSLTRIARALRRGAASRNRRLRRAAGRGRRRNRQVCPRGPGQLSRRSA